MQSRTFLSRIPVRKLSTRFCVVFLVWLFFLFLLRLGLDLSLTLALLLLLRGIDSVHHIVRSLLCVARRSMDVLDDMVVRMLRMLRMLQILR